MSKIGPSSRYGSRLPVRNRVIEAEYLNAQAEKTSALSHQTTREKYVPTEWELLTSRGPHIAWLFKEKGMTISEIRRLLGVSYQVAYRAVTKKKPERSPWFADEK